LEAKYQGAILAVKPYLDLMIAQGRHIGQALRDQILQQAGE
jgi:predicted nucleic acid-binding protein